MTRGKRRRADGYVLEKQVGHLLRRAHQRASAIFLAELGEAHQVTPRQYAALVKLSDLGEQSQNELGRITAMDPATIQGVIRRLVARAIPLGKRVTLRTLDPLTAREQGLFLRLLERLGDPA